MNLDGSIDLINFKRVTFTQFELFKLIACQGTRHFIQPGIYSYYLNEGDLTIAALEVKLYKAIKPAFFVNAAAYESITDIKITSTWKV